MTKLQAVLYQRHSAEPPTGSQAEGEPLPAGWCWTALGNVAIPRREDLQPDANPGLRYVGLEHLVSGRCTLDAWGEASEVRSLKSRFCPGDVLYGKLRPYLDKAALAEWDGMCSTDIIVVSPTAAIVPRLLAYLLHTHSFIEQATASSRGVQLPRTSWKDIESFEFALPPLAEQRRIVAALDTALARVNAARERLARVPGILKRFRAAVLSAAVEGRLTEDWRAAHPDVEPADALLRRILDERRRKWEEAERERYTKAGKTPPMDWRGRYKEPAAPDTSDLSELPESWCWTTVEQAASDMPRSIQSGPFGSALLHSESQPAGILAIGIDNVLDGRFSMGREHRISPAKFQDLNKFAARPLDVLMTVMATVGRCCVVPANLEPAIITKHVYRISPDHNLANSHYLMTNLQGGIEARRYLSGQIRGQTRPGVNGEILRGTPIALAPLAEQCEILRRRDRLLESADAIETRALKAESQVEQVMQALLAKAFRGELVPQDRADEPAAVLLERVRRERGATAPAMHRHGPLDRRT